MATNSRVTFQKLPFMQDPDHFLRSYFWGCDEGHKLSVRCKQQMERATSGDREVQGLKTYRPLAKGAMDSLLDCYVHTRICSRCISIENMPCQQGYQLMKARDSASDRAVRLGVGDESSKPYHIESMSPERIQAALDKVFTQKELLHHESNCEVCILNRPKGRYSILAWNIEVARSHKLP
jgi:hypothetical protein